MHEQENSDRINRLEKVADELELELGMERDESGRIDYHSTKVLKALGYSGIAQGLIYALLDLEDDKRVNSVSLENLRENNSVDVYLTQQFRNVQSLEKYLREHNLPDNDVFKIGKNYRLSPPEGVSVKFSALRKD